MCLSIQSKSKSCIRAITLQFLTYTVYLCSEYTYADLVKCCGKVRAMSDTCGASGNTSDTNTKHGLHE